MKYSELLELIEKYGDITIAEAIRLEKKEKNGK